MKDFINLRYKYLNISPIALLTLKDKNYINSFREVLKGKGGIYSFINNKQYIGSVKDLYIRLNEHLNNKKSNVHLQRAIIKYELDKFNWVVYEYFSYINKIISNEDLTTLETSYIKSFNPTTLYNFKLNANSRLGYIHTVEKMKEYYKDKNNHPMYGKTHSDEARSIMAKKRNKWCRNIWFKWQFN
uniref:GIY-YIG endonuclease n=1 Tax=Metarhizium rileyi (strain RCEF 4871) TaxID=1649241 RepID=A0A6H0B8N8_METRR|nr:GIY-YIG endonuclease [Metarhizium rileyi]QIS49119.1 GIY-YIG endonuclease [Metarhizium rileyi]